MSINIGAIYNLEKLLGSREASNVVQLAKKQERLEAIWRREMKEEIDRTTRKIISNASETGRLKLSEVNFDEIVMRHSYEVMKSGIKSTEAPPTLRGVKLAAPPPAKIPRSLKALRILWDRWRATGMMPPRQKAISNKIRKAYCAKVQSVWVKYGDEFRSGSTASITEVVRKMEEGADVAYSRAKMIVETETTYYYNKARRDIYDESPDVTHYLFVAIRDHATTKWCKSRQGLVYKKGSKILDKETPPIHWYCRSEILPLTWHNPNHRKLIEDLKRARMNNHCEPLPPGWTSRAA